MTRIEQLFLQLGYNRGNGLFYLSESDSWIHLFPYRISKVLRDIIKPYAFHSLHHQGDINTEHPEPINNPIILFFDKPDLATTNEIPKWSFCFGQAPIVIINKSDFAPLDIYHGYKFEAEHNYLLKNIDTNVDTFSLINLTLGKTWKTLYQQHYKNVPKVDKYLLNNIIDARRILIANDGYKLDPKIANRLIGRLLFVRYLIDRRVEFKGQNYIVGNDKVSRQESLNELIRQKTPLYEFFDYLTDKYEGDLFPLQEFFLNEETGETITRYDEIQHVSNSHLEVLYYLFSGSSFFHTGTVHMGYTVQPSLFNVYDFEIIPVELISNIYENFIGKSEENIDVKLGELNKKSKQFDIKAYYTPPFIVDYVLSQTVTPFLLKSGVASCKVLDPACGSGIFLVETLRKIIEKEIISINSAGKLTNARLWELLKQNIFGIDIDEDAIEITIFSLYITLLDYKTPIEIEEFKFEKLKGENLFGDSGSDFFNTSAVFNDIFQNHISLDFILGNPPWGKVKHSKYENYISTRRKLEVSSQVTLDLNRTKLVHPKLPIAIGNREISQAFLVRVSDFAQNENMKVALVVTAKSLYNSDSTTKKWRNYFLSNFIVSQVMELSSVNNKIVGGSQIFEQAKQAPAILFFKVATSLEEIRRNIITHIAVRPNRFFNYFRTIVIEKHDIKQIRQKNFIEWLGGYDWLWKVMLHGNILDYFFILRLKDYAKIGDLMTNYKLVANGGLKIKDGSRKYDTTALTNYKYLDTDLKKEFQAFNLSPTRTWSEFVKDKFATTQQGKKGSIGKDGEVGYLPDTSFFMGEKLLVKKGLQAKEGFKAVAAYTSEDLVFSSTVVSIKSSVKRKSKVITSLLKNLAGIINSRFFSYYILHSSSSAGIDRTRIDFEEIFSSPAFFDDDFSAIVSDIQSKYISMGKEDFYTGKVEELNKDIIRLTEESEIFISNYFDITDSEQALIDYSTEIAIPILKRAEESSYESHNIFNMLSPTNELDKSYLVAYATVFIDHFKHRFNSKKQFFFVNVYVANDFVGFHFIVESKSMSEDQIVFKQTSDSVLLSEMGNLGIHNITRDLYIQQDVRGFNKNTFYIIELGTYEIINL